MCINLRDLRLVGLRLIDSRGDYLVNIIHNKDRLSLWSTLPIPSKHHIIGLKLAKKQGRIVKFGFILWQHPVCMVPIDQSPIEPEFSSLQAEIYSFTQVLRSNSEVVEVGPFKMEPSDNTRKEFCVQAYQTQPRLKLEKLNDQLPEKQDTSNQEVKRSGVVRIQKLKINPREKIFRQTQRRLIVGRQSSLLVKT